MEENELKLCKSSVPKLYGYQYGKSMKTSGNETDKGLTGSNFSARLPGPSQCRPTGFTYIYYRVP
jgi:hypothetical protein